MIKNQFDPENSYQGTVKTMDPEQFECIVKAIVEGKYSWACVLILRFAGYNPAYYIPYRTYKRLLKENRRSQMVEQTVQASATNQSSSKSTKCSFPQTMRSSVLAETRQRWDGCSQ